MKQTNNNSRFPQQATHQNHYVPIWYQKGFIVGGRSSLHYLDLCPSSTKLQNGRTITGRSLTHRAPKSCFWSDDLYTTRFGGVINDEIERYLFGTIDDFGARAVRAFLSGDMSEIHKYFRHFFEYLDAQKLRTPKGLDWIKSKYPELTQLDLMIEMQGLRMMHCTMWYESVMEIISAELSDVKFIITDHPVTIYNAAYPSSSQACIYPDDPAIELKGSQTVFAIDANHCLIITNLEYAKNPTNIDLRSPRTHARYAGQSIARTDSLIRKRKLSSNEVVSINRLLKSRAKRYIAASEQDWLLPEKTDTSTWESISRILLPPSDELWHFGGEIYIGFQDGSTHYQDEFGRTSGSHQYLMKQRTSPFDRAGFCGCGSGRKFKQCCERLLNNDRPSWDVYSIRERNLMFIRATLNILGITDGKSWEDVRKELSDDQVKKIHEAYESLWPKDTDLVDLLPRPDKGILRTVYLGLIDPRKIPATVLGWLPYFDEIIIVNPFINASTVKPDFSPTKSPGHFKAQTLKNVLLLMMLEPFINAGIVHMMPDISDFSDIRQVLRDMAEQRVGKNIQLDEADTRINKILYQDDMMRVTRSLPDDALRSQIQRAVPELSQEQIVHVIADMREHQKYDPFALLQDFPPGEEGAQFLTAKSFNLEVALFLAQLTESVIYTDVGLHWEHLHQHATTDIEQKNKLHWKSITDLFGKIPFIVESNPEAAFQIRNNDKYKNIRHKLRELRKLVYEIHDKPVSKHTMRELIREFDNSKNLLRRDIKRRDRSKINSLLTGHLELSIPSGGFNLNTVRRLLITYGRAKRIQTMKMAFFVRMFSLSDPVNKRTNVSDSR